MQLGLVLSPKNCRWGSTQFSLVASFSILRRPNATRRIMSEIYRTASSADSRIRESAPAPSIPRETRSAQKLEIAAKSARHMILLAALSISGVVGAQTTALYEYDALGRLKRVDLENGSYITYTYDAAGNRRAVLSSPTGGASPPSGSPPGAPPPPPATALGTITYANARYPSGCSSCTGEFWIEIRNSGTANLTNVSLSLARPGVAGCVATANTVASLAPNQVARFTWVKNSSASAFCGPTVSAGNASNSPVVWNNL